MVWVVCCVVLSFTHQAHHFTNPFCVRLWRFKYIFLLLFLLLFTLFFTIILNFVVVHALGQVKSVGFVCWVVYISCFHSCSAETCFNTAESRPSFAVSSL